MNCRYIKPILLVVMLVVFDSRVFATEFQVVDLNENVADIQIMGGEGLHLNIVSVTTGDLNGDKVQDIVMGGANLHPIVIEFGRKSYPSSIQYSVKTPPSLRIIYSRLSTDFEPIVQVADLNGDGLDDLLIPTDLGLDVFWGRKHWPLTIDMKTQRPDLRILGVREFGPKGLSKVLVKTRDINRDGIEDLFLNHTAYPANPPQEAWTAKNQKIVWLFLGKKSWPAVINLNNDEAALVIWAPQPTPFGERIRQFEINDLDGDGFEDIVIGAWGRMTGTFKSPKSGPWETAWIIRGTGKLPKKIQLKSRSDLTSFQSSSLKKDEQITTIQPLEGAVFSAGLVSGDFNGDRRSDLIFPFFVKRNNELQRQLCLILGRAEFFKKKSIAIGNDCVIVSGGSRFKDVYPYNSRPPILGDFNGDGRDDIFLLLGYPDFIISGILGRQDVGRETNFDQDARIHIHTPLKNPGSSTFASSMALRDINGDGREDLLIVDTFGGKERSKIGPGLLHIFLGQEMKNGDDLTKEHSP